MPSGWSELALQCGGMCSASDTMESLKGKCESPLSYPSSRIKHFTRGQTEGTTRFPKLDECAHFHYENVDLGSIKVTIWDEKSEASKLAVLPSTNGTSKQSKGLWFTVFVTNVSKTWSVRRSYENFQMLDRQLHHCVYDRKYSQLTELPSEDSFDEIECKEEYVRTLLAEYLERFSQLAGNLINCGPVLNWLELDNRGNRLIVADEAAINTPAVAAAYVVKRYSAQANDEISFEVGDMVSVIDMPPPEESTWWRGKKGFEVGFFPCECVEVIGNKLPQTIKTPKVPTKPVLRKHGKLIAFFRSFLLSRPSRRKLKQTGILKERVFGCDLGEHLMNTGRDIPLVLKCCTEFIEEHGILDGIYRLSGVTSNIQKLRLAFDEDKIPDLTDEAILQDIHCMASLLKMYFRELPNPLLTYQLYDKFVAAVQSDDDLRLLKLRDVIQQLPPPHYRTCEFLMKHLAKVAAYGNKTGMTPKNVAIVWAPNLLRSRDVEGGGVGALHVVGVQAILTEYLIRYVDLIFSDRIPAFPSPCLEDGSPKRIRPKSLAISTPTKLLSLEEARSRALSANLLPMQQKYIDVGGGPQNLPEKYHTVIDLPINKQGTNKLKKSPSGWKSFFSRGWYSSSTRGRKEIHSSNRSRKGHKIKISPQQTHLALQDKAVTESDISHITKLRTVKSAESLMSLGGGMSSCNSEILNSFSPSDGNKMFSPHQLSNDEATISENGQFSPFKSPSHLKHIRSMSHDSYFESGLGIPLEEEEMEEESSIFHVNSVSDTESTKIKYKKLINEKDDENINIDLENFKVITDDISKTETDIIEKTTDDTMLDLEVEKQINSLKEIQKQIDDKIIESESRKSLKIETEMKDSKLADEELESEKDKEDKSENERMKPDYLVSQTSHATSTVSVTQTLLKHVGDGVVAYRSPEDIQPYHSPLRINHSSHYCRESNTEASKSSGDQYEETIVVEIHAIQDSSEEDNENNKVKDGVNFHENGELVDQDIHLNNDELSENGKENSSRCSLDLSDTQELLLNMSMEATISDTLSLSQLQSYDSVKYSTYSGSAAQNSSNLQVTATDNMLNTPESPTMGNISDMPSTVEISTDESFDRTNNSSETDKISDNIYEDSSNEETNDVEKSDMKVCEERQNMEFITLSSADQKDDTEESERLLLEAVDEENDKISENETEKVTMTKFSENKDSAITDQVVGNLLIQDDDLIDFKDQIDGKIDITNFDKADINDSSGNAKVNLIDSELKHDNFQISSSDVKTDILSKEKSVESSSFVDVPQEKHSVHFEMKDNVNHKAYERILSSENSFRVSSILSDGVFSSIDANKSPFSLRKQFGLEKLSPVSPVEESRRKFESEIGRTIVRDRKMRLEMEQIQAERQKNDLKKQVLVSPGESSINNRPHSKLRHHSSEEIPCSKLAENRIYDGSDVWRSTGRHAAPSSEKDRKRGSDPQDILSRFRTEQIYLEQKRSSEPKCIYFERKSSVKELLSKFEPKSTKDNSNTSHQQVKRELSEIPKPQLDICNDCKMGTTSLQISLMKPHNESSGMRIRSESEHQEVYHSLPDFSFQPSSTVQRSSSSTSVPSVLSSKTGKLLSRCCSQESQVTPIKVICSKTTLKSPIAIRPQSLNFEKSKTAKSLICESPDIPNRNAFLSHVNISNETGNSLLKKSDGSQVSTNISQCSYQDHHLHTSGKESFQCTKFENREERCIEKKDQLRSLHSNILEGLQENSEPNELLSNNRHTYAEQKVPVNTNLPSNVYGKKSLNSSLTSGTASKFPISSLHQENSTVSSRTPKCSSVINSLVQESEITTNIKCENSNLDVPKSKK
ncbi:uncharacterized protein [Centruroides vittatus]|uniref:uncharacterized protein isoform X1 n=3 Tax=Centruroides vittatus TaxID=120091 RepID=UPI00350EF02D